MKGHEVGYMLMGKPERRGPSNLNVTTIASAIYSEYHETSEISMMKCSDKSAGARAIARA